MNQLRTRVYVTGKSMSQRVQKNQKKKKKTVLFSFNPKESNKAQYIFSSLIKNGV